MLHRNLRSGIKISVVTVADWVIYNDIFVEGEYDKPINSILQELSTAEQLNILDIGAGVGFFTLRFVDLMRHNGFVNQPYSITAVEGSPKLAKELENRIYNVNNLQDNVEIVKGLVGKRDGTGTILERDFHPMNTTLIESEEGVQVEYVDLYKIKAANVGIDLLKCDIEGAELLFAQNYLDLLRKVKFAAMELHPKLCNTKQCIDILKDAGLAHNEILRSTDDFIVVYFWR